MVEELKEKQCAWKFHKARQQFKYSRCSCQSWCSWFLLWPSSSTRSNFRWPDLRESWTPRWSRCWTRWINDFEMQNEIRETISTTLTPCSDRFENIKEIWILCSELWGEELHHILRSLHQREGELWTQDPLLWSLRMSRIPGSIQVTPINQRMSQSDLWAFFEEPQGPEMEIKENKNLKSPARERRRTWRSSDVVKNEKLSGVWICMPRPTTWRSTCTWKRAYYLLTNIFHSSGWTSSTRSMPHCFQRLGTMIRPSTCRWWPTKGSEPSAWPRATSAWPFEAGKVCMASDAAESLRAAMIESVIPITNGDWTTFTSTTCVYHRSQFAKHVQRHKSRLDFCTWLSGIISPGVHRCTFWPRKNIELPQLVYNNT